MRAAWREIANLGAASLLVCGLAGCSRRPSGSIALELSAGSTARPAAGVGAQSGADSLVFSAGTDTLIIREAALAVREMEIAPADAGDCEGTPDEHEEECPVLATGPTVLQLPLGTGGAPGLTVSVPPDAYSLLQFQIQTLDAERDRDFLAAHPEFRQGSIHLRGEFSRAGTREPVEFWARFNEREELALEPPLVVAADSTATLTLRVSVAGWFRDADRSGLVDPAAAGPDQPYESLVRDNIRRSLRAIAAKP